MQIAGSGRYDIVAGDAGHPTLVSVIDGAAQVSGTGIALQVGPHQTASISGTDTYQGSVGPVVEDGFLAAMLSAERPARRGIAAIPPVVAGMTGSEDLLSEGDWAETPQYGAVWYPPVQAGWVPYREGRWSYVGQWGWTWVDQAPWGFAPFHYGRWAQIDDRWGWIPASPGGYAGPGNGYPVAIYAPALVGFIGLGVGVAIGERAFGRSVGWVPLGPREPYYPPYRADIGYVRAINATTVQNVNQTINQTTIVNNRTTVVQNFVNRNAATVVPASAMVQSSPVGASARPLPAQDFARAQMQSVPPVRPAATTIGVTPAVARRFNFIVPRTAQTLPGPAITPAVLRAGPGRAFAPPALRVGAPGAAGVPQPGQAAVSEPLRPDIGPRPPGVAGPEMRPALRPAEAPQAPRPVAPPAAEPLRPVAPPPGVGVGAALGGGGTRRRGSSGRAA